MSFVTSKIIDLFECSHLFYLKSSNSSRLEPEISFEILGNLSHQTLEGQLSDEQLSGLLVSSNLTEGDGSRPVSVRLLDSSS